MAGDINLAGEKFYGNLFREIKELKADIPILTEYFRPPQKDYLNELSRSFGEFSVEISPESSSENIRRINGREYSNESLEKSIADAKEAGSDILSSAEASEVLRSLSFITLPLQGYQCSLCTYPCLHTIDLCLPQMLDAMLC